MTITIGGRKHPERTKLSAAIDEDKDRLKSRKGLIDKRATLVKTTADGDDLVSETGATMRPSDDQLERINKFTRKAVTADEVVAFKTLSCNDIPDRDDDRFTTNCVKGFAELEQPFSPTGKSYMLDHEYKVANAVGRIFGTDTQKVEGALFLTNEVYMPNTAQFQPLIEKIDFGINWAVSVGVMLGKDECSLSFCKAPFSSWGWWCQNGHDKGLYYTEDAEEDAWGWPTPCDPDTNGAEKCLRNFDDPKDMYELSQVFLGAQYFAALEKTPEFASIVKSAATGKGVPIIGLSEKEADQLPLHKEPRRVTEARLQFGVEEMEDGTIRWVDDQRLVWLFDPTTDEIASLGRQADPDTQEDEDAEGNLGSTEGDEVSLQLQSGNEGDGTLDGQVHRSSDDGQALNHAAEGSTEPLGGEPGEVTAAAEDSDSGEEDEEENTEVDTEENEDDDSETDQNVVALATSAGIPEAVLAAAKGVTGKKVLPVLFAAVSAEFQKLSKKAALGDAFLRGLQAEAIDWYVKAHKTSDTSPVKTETFEKILARCEDDVDLIQNLIDENKALAQAKFPKSVRRSSFPTDANVQEKPRDISWDDETDQKVKKLHS